MTGNTMLIAGGGSGIGRALAEAFHGLGNQVIVAGRRQNVLDETTAANPGMRSALLDIADPAAIRAFAEQIGRDFPALNLVVHNAGIMQNEDVKGGKLEVAESTVATNLRGPIRLNTALLPLLLGQPRTAVLTVSSGLAFMPLALTPTQCATKAAIHSYTQSLRYQLQGTPVQVTETHFHPTSRPSFRGQGRPETPMPCRWPTTFPRRCGCSAPRRTRTKSGSSGSRRSATPRSTAAHRATTTRSSRPSTTPRASAL